jgi:hypothetical protein
MVNYHIERSDRELTLTVVSIPPDIYAMVLSGDVVFSSDNFVISFHPYGENSFPVLDFGRADIFIDIKRGFSPVSRTITGYVDEDLDILEERIKVTLDGDPLR